MGDDQLMSLAKHFLPFDEQELGNFTICGTTINKLITLNNADELQYPWDLFKLVAPQLENKNQHIASTAVIEDNVEISGNVFIGENCHVSSGTKIKGNVYIDDNCFIGNNVFIRGNTSIASHCTFGFSTEIKSAIIQSNTGIGHLCYIADTIVGAHVFTGGLVRTSNYRLDGQNIAMDIDNQRILSNTTRLGCLIGSNTKIGSSVVIFPGRKIGKNCVIGPQVQINKNLTNNSNCFIKQDVIVSNNN